MTREFASIGLGFGTALGVARGRPDIPTILVIGDGGFLMTMGSWKPWRGRIFRWSSS